MTQRNTFEYRKKLYKPNFLDGIYKLDKNYNELDQYDTDAFDRLLVSEYKKKGLDIALNINSLSKQLKLSHKEIDGYLMWLYKKGSIILFSNGYGNSFYDKEKNSDKNIENIYLIRLNKTFVNKIDKNLQIIAKNLQNKIKNVKYKATYDKENNKLLINGEILSKQNEFSVNKFFISFLIDNPNMEFHINEIGDMVRNNLKDDGFVLKNIQKRIYDLGFRGEIKKAFFKVSKTRLIFINPIDKSRLQKLGIKKLNLKRISRV